MVIATAVYHRQLAVLVQALKTGHAAAEAEVLVDFAELLWLDADGGAVAVIGVVAVRHERVEPIVAAGEFQHHEDLLRRVGGGGGKCPGRLAKGDGQAQTAHRLQRQPGEAGAQHITPAQIALRIKALWHDAPPSSVSPQLVLRQAHDEMQE
jgi:hypothetical protein